MDKIIQKLKTFFENKQNRYVAGIIFGVIIIALFIYFFNLFPALEKIIQFGSQVKVIDDELVIPQTERVSPADGRIIQKGSYDTLLVPKSEEEEVLVVKAKLTVKGSYDSAIVRAK